MKFYTREESERDIRSICLLCITQEEGRTKPFNAGYNLAQNTSLQTSRSYKNPRFGELDSFIREKIIITKSVRRSQLSQPGETSTPKYVISDSGE